MFAHIPGFKVVAPSTVADAKGLLAAAIATATRSCTWSTSSWDRVAGPDRRAPDPDRQGEGGTLRCGRDGHHLLADDDRCLEAAESLAAEGVDVEVIDLRSLRRLTWTRLRRPCGRRIAWWWRTRRYGTVVSGQRSLHVSAASCLTSWTALLSVSGRSTRRCRSARRSKTRSCPTSTTSAPRSGPPPGRSVSVTQRSGIQDTSIHGAPGCPAG